MFAHESAFSKTQFHHSQTWVYEGILFIRLKSELTINLELALQMQSDWHTLQNDTKKTVLDLNDMVYVHPSVRTLCASTHEPIPVNMVAIYARSKYLQLIGKAFAVIDSPPYSVRVFNDLNKALLWLRR